MVDTTQIYQVLMNLCTNASHAMREKGGILKVTLDEVRIEPDATDIPPDMKPGGYTRLTLTDTGVGMTPEVMARIFEPFFTTKSKERGTGLGLSVVHGIITAHGGGITVKSRIGGGSQFTVYLPVAPDMDSSEATGKEEIPKGSERILLVDDEEFIVDLGQQLMSSLGYRVTGCTSSSEALQKFSMTPEQYDLVITDMTMPEMTGDLLLEEILRIRPGMPVILCTGYNENLDEKKTLELGAKALVMKPFVLREIASVIRIALATAA